VGLVTGFSPLLLCAGAAAVAVRRLDRAHRSRFRAIVMRPIPGLYGLVWVVLGLCAAVSSWWIVPAALALALLRATVWLAGHRLDSGLPTRYAPDAIAPVLGLNFVITGDPALALGGGVATTFVVLVIAGVAAAPWLERRDTPSARLTSDVVVTELRC